jgi:hypothetical protein
MVKATQSTLERMTSAKWVQTARNEKGLLIEWTAEGTEAAKQFRVLFDKLGSELSADELGALLTIIDTMSPGGTDAATGNAVQ